MFSARRILYPERRPVPPPHPLPSYTSHVLTTQGRASFDVWLLDTPSPRARLLMCHGFYANRYQVLEIAEGLRQRGYEVLLFELPNKSHRPTSIRCSGVIVRVEPVISNLQQGHYHVAVLFTELAERDRTAIARFVRQRLSASSSAH